MRARTTEWKIGGATQAQLIVDDEGADNNVVNVEVC